ncbi:MAG: isocitrate/isopropylmalate dehydrogenase family protein [Deltaproteobacteria bacterium]|nr:isocitrate/isopropylmalate dehydrogenase family protein [Deltaproteobacteria bacterium]
MSKHVVVIRGEDSSPEAVDPAVALMRGLGLPIEWSIAPVGVEAKETHGKAFPDEARALIDESDTTLFGATSGASAGALFYLRWGKETFANVRPVRWVNGMKSPLANPGSVDFVIVRENLEDLYLFAEGDLDGLDVLDLVSPTAGKKLHEMAPGKFAIKAITELGSERIARFAFRLAQRRKALGYPGKVSCGTKHNMLPQSDGLFRRVAQEVSNEFDEIEFESFIVDDLAHRLVGDSGHFDVVLLPNLYGDILSDAAAGLAGGLGLAPSGCYGESYAYFESAHGTAPDIAGKNIINPTATLLSGAMMLDHLGFEDAGTQLRAALERVYEEAKVLTPDQGGTASTTEFCSAVESEV